MLGFTTGTEDFNSFPFLRANPSFFAGSAGSLSVPNLGHFSANENANWHHPFAWQYMENGPSDSYTRQIAHFVEGVRGDASRMVPARDAARTHALIEATRVAAEGSTAVVADEYAASIERIGGLV